MKLSDIPWRERGGLWYTHDVREGLRIWLYKNSNPRTYAITSIDETGKLLPTKEFWLELDELSAQCVLLAILNGDTYPEGNDLGDTTP